MTMEKNLLIVPLDDVRPGMQLAAPVKHPDHPDQDLLKRGYVIEETVLSRLRDLGIACRRSPRHMRHSCREGGHPDG